ncbi:hypothetical protein [uncultured Vagococcus sp.]|uniref:hypothetical protein n=1 Tax=uncultured Vagococcus sp. TaxID=189676 RepID=UPI0028D0369A|nr:hypothetical protein [uncultured Vagococcus sp.]
MGVPTYRKIVNQAKKLADLENELSKTLQTKGIEGYITYRVDENSICCKWDSGNDEKVSLIKNQKELTELLELPLKEALIFLEKRSV